MKARVLLCLTVFLLAGCTANSDSSTQTAKANWELRVQDDFPGATLVLGGAYLHGSNGWVSVLDNGTKLELTGSGGNVTVTGSAPVGTYSQLRVLFESVLVANTSTVLVENGINLVFTSNVTKAGNNSVGIGFAWADSLFQSEQGIAFEPIVQQLTTVEGGVPALALTAQGIMTMGGLPPVARMRIFDASGLEAFASSFVAESPEQLFIANAGELALSATPSEALQPGATLDVYRWDVGGQTLEGASVVYDTGLAGGELTVRLTVKDSAGGQDTQTVRLAVKPALVNRHVNFTSTITGLDAVRTASAAVADALGPPKSHPFAVDTTLDGMPARLMSIVVALSLTSSTGSQLHDLDLKLFNTTGAQAASVTGGPTTSDLSAASKHTITYTVKADDRKAGNWAAQVIPRYAAQAAYKVDVTMIWQLNPEMADFIASYDDGHAHSH
jgi:hypothetical protein